MRKSAKLGSLFVVVLAFVFTSVPLGVRADEGQWPLSMLAGIDLKAKGFAIEKKDLFNPDGPSLIDAICRVNGATGSFISNDGLILTNHHVAFDGLAQASTPEKDHLTNGFAAKDRSEELPARGYSCRITVSYKDVSKEILEAIKPDTPPGDRSRAVGAKSRELIAAAEKDAPGHKAEVSEMFQGKSYVLFLYRDIRDVRIVCAPPRAVGEYGGEDDNWMWPRHTGDFTFLRAYVGPNGESAAYSKTNVPFHPKRFLKVNPRGIEEKDLVFLLGYPGRTFRHQTSHYMNYEEKVRLPFTADLFEAQIAIMEAQSKRDAAAALKIAPTIKSRANTMKNFRGKIQGLARLGLVEKKRAEEKELAAWIDADPTRKEAFGTVLAEIGAIYDDMLKAGTAELILPQLATSPIGMGGLTNAIQKATEGPATDSAPTARPVGAERPTVALDPIRESDRLSLRNLLKIAIELPEESVPAAFKEWAAAYTKEGETSLQTADRILASTGMFEDGFGRNLAKKTAEEIRATPDSIVQMAILLRPVLTEIETRGRDRRGRLDALMARYLDAKMAWKTNEFVPDANSTLRMTFGHVKSYTPKDGLVALPFTTLAGVLEKHTGNEPFDAPDAVIERKKANDLGDFVHPRLGDVPVAFLYDTDTTGGNSGSPIMNKSGELVGVNFDRTFEATINDYQWSEAYSRSIGCDIRYVLWITQKIMKADSVLEELAVK